MRKLTLPSAVLAGLAFWRPARASAKCKSYPSVPMSDTKRVLVAIAKPAVLAKLEALQTPVEVHFERAANGQALEALARRRAYDLIVVELPFPGLDLSDCLETLRSSECASAKSPMVLLARENSETDLGKLDPSLLELVTRCTSLAEALKVVADTVHPRARLSARLLAEIETSVDSARSRRVCQTVNISASGMLLRTKRCLPPTFVLPFSLQLPFDSDPIHGRGEVVRHTDFTTEAVSGMGVRFLDFEGNGSLRLEAFLGLQVG